MSFDVLSRAISLNRHHLIEASAGTGKTFTIEHLFVRRLIEPTLQGKYATVSEIAVLTFTRAVARELVIRIRRSLDQAIHYLSGPSDVPNIPEYLLQVMEQGSDVLQQVKWRLQTARADLETAPITTIHGFCFKTLSEFAEVQGQETATSFATPFQIREMVEDFFSRACPADRYSVLQLAKLLHVRQYNFQELCQKVISRVLEEWFEDHPVEDVHTNVSTLLQMISAMKQELGWSEQSVFAGLELLSTYFTGCRTKAGELHEEIYRSFLAFSKLFTEGATAIDALIRHPFFASDVFSTQKAPKKGEERNLEMLSHLLPLEPFIKKLADPDMLLDALAVHCRQFVRQQMVKKGLYSHDELLYQMDKALDQEAFIRFLGSRYAAVIVDEFQDTDPLQWKIISKGLLQQHRAIVSLVGDPKQAIYSFRRADVYSYIQARSELKGADRGSLLTNYRSSPSLIRALNALFVGPHSSLLFFLPRLNESLDVPMLLPGKGGEDDDGCFPIQFFIGKEPIGRKRSWPTKEMEEEVLFPYIAGEITGPFSQWAILVKDRHQAERIESYLTQSNIPARAWRRSSTVCSTAHQILERLIASILSPRDRGRLLQFLSREPLMYSDEECLQLQNEAIWARHVVHLLSLRQSYEEGGLSCLLQHFLSTPWTEAAACTMEETCASMQGGFQILRDMEMLVDHLITRPEVVQAGLANLFDELLLLKEYSEGEREQFLSRYDDKEDAVQIITMHSSKGLEFDYVFALGLANRSPFQSESEEEAEKLRQFYVACTRAKKRLYLPLVLDEDEKIPQEGTASPMELFMTYLDCALQEGPVARAMLTDRAYIYSQIHQRGQLRALDYLTSQAGIAAATLSCQKRVARERSPAEPVFQGMSPSIDVEYKKCTYTSYSKMKRRDSEVESVDVPTGLDRGFETGIVLHMLLATLLKKKLRLEALHEIVTQELFGTHLQGSEEEVVLLFNKLIRAPFPSPHGSFCLTDIDLRKSYCEMEFLFDLEVSAPNTTSFARGVVDFIFEHNGFTYIVDWKSNVLEDYSQERLCKAVLQEQYLLQASLYAKSWQRYLDTLQAEKKPPFGGFFFVFLRGVGEGSSGILFINSKELQL